MTTTRTHFRHFLFLLIGGLLAPAPVSAQEQVLYFHSDAIGSVRAITDAGGAQVALYDYMPFGELPPTNPPQPPDTRQFASKERDLDTTKLDYFGARYYRPESGRFTTVDPGHVGGDIFNPQSWNAYAYALNNPLRFVDPLGTCSQDKGGNYVDADDGGTLVVPGPCPRGKDGGLTIGITESVSVRPKSGITSLAEGISAGAGPVASPLFIAGFYGVSAMGGAAVAALPATSAAVTLGLESYVPFSLTATYAAGIANYQVIIREVEALARSTGGRAQLTPQQIRALLQNVQDVMNRTAQSGQVESLRRQASLPRWQFLGQLPAEAQAAFRAAMAKHGIRIP